MEAKLISPDTHDVMFTATLAEFAELYSATRPGRHTKSQQRLLEVFGYAIGSALPEVLEAAVELEGTSDAST